MLMLDLKGETEMLSQGKVFAYCGNQLDELLCC